MPRRRSQSDAVSQLLKQAAELSQSERVALISGLQALIKPEDERDEYGKPVNQEGYIEEKFINGCGPYRYLRYWDGKTHKSVYIGKKEEEQGSSRGKRRRKTHS
ncbi:MAG TPA: hypothetical protein V6D19_02875 [Stenomitos sp.]